jgi:hypothetical protein
MKAKDGIQPPTPPKIKRFPRLPEGLNMAKLAKSVWTRPTFRAEEVDGITTFAFGIDLRDKIRSHNEHIYRSLFESGGPVWAEALETAYPSASSGKKTVAEYIDKKLYIVFRDALQAMMAHAKTIAKNYEGMTHKGHSYPALFEQNVDKQIKTFVSKSSRKGRQRIHQVDDKRSIRLAQRYKTLAPLVLELKHFLVDLKTKGPQDEVALLDEVNKNYQGQEWIARVLNRDVFRALLRSPDDILPAHLTLSGEWDPHDLVIGIITCEERPRPGRPILAFTIKKLIDRGMELI